MHFIDISDFKKNELKKIINFAKKIKRNPKKFHNLLKNKSIGLLFEKSSNRTRTSIDIGMKNIGGNVISLNKDEIGFGKRESDSDIIRTLSLYIDCLIIRNNDHKKIRNLSKLDFIPIINGLSDYSHPCQTLSDIFTIEEKLGKIENKNISWFGDINNVLISLIHASNIFKFKLKIASPKKILKINENLLNNFQSKNIILSSDSISVIKNADCIMTDVWSSMGGKSSLNRLKAFKHFQINEKLMTYAKKNAIFMHCLPANRNKEVTDSVIDGKQSIVWDQAKNRMYVQQSIMNFCIKKFKGKKLDF